MQLYGVYWFQLETQATACVSFCVQFCALCIVHRGEFFSHLMVDVRCGLLCAFMIECVFKVLKLFAAIVVVPSSSFSNKLPIVLLALCAYNNTH